MDSLRAQADSTGLPGCVFSAIVSMLNHCVVYGRDSKDSFAYFLTVWAGPCHRNLTLLLCPFSLSSLFSTCQLPICQATSAGYSSR